MSEEIRVNKPAINPSAMSSNMPAMGHGGMSRNNLPWVVLAIVALLIIVGAVLFRDRLFPGQAKNNPVITAEQKVSGYQAVFLSNGQVYFGKLSDMSATYATLKDIYYLQVVQPPLQGSQQNTQPDQQPQLSLVKLGEELHGPVDEMKINRDQILFYEDMKEDGRVMKAIRENQNNPAVNNSQGQSSPANQTSPNTQTTPTAPVNNR
jgi:hypothetical protein